VAALPYDDAQTTMNGVPTMKHTTGLNRHAVRAAIGAGAAAGALLIGTAPAALAAPPNCTAADLAGVAAGVSAATSAYLFTHPQVNDFFTGLEGSPRDTLRPAIQQYLNANPTVQAELQGIRQPLLDIKARCGGGDVADDGIDTP
jgi:hemophore-related protein